MEILNRKARFNYFIIDEIESGIVLCGNEIKSIRNSSANINDSYGRIINNEVYLINMYIKKYEESGVFASDERRQRKLLLHKDQIIKLVSKINKEPLTLIPLKIYNKGNKIKVLLGICKGKKNYDKKQVLKERDIEKNIKMNLKRF